MTTRMTRVIRRLLLAVPLILVVSFLVFLLQRLAGGSYFDQFKTDRRFDPAQIRELERRAHLDQPLLLQYLHWLRGVCFDVRVGRPRHELAAYLLELSSMMQAKLPRSARSGRVSCSGISGSASSASCTRTPSRSRPVYRSASSWDSIGPSKRSWMAS